MATASSLKDFILAALREDQRIDGRRPFDSRRLSVKFSREDGMAEVQLGQTHVMCVVSAQLVQPYPERPNEGNLAVYTEFSPMADPSFEAGRPGESAVELGRIIDRGLRESRAVDTESLCVLAGKAVWSLRIDICILDNGGNLIDAASAAALAALLSFRKPECSTGSSEGAEVIIHSPEIREPLPLILHYLPIAVTFAFFGDGDFVVMDPSYNEELVMKGRLTVIMTIHGDICTIQKGGGVGVTSSELMRCLRIASAKVADVTTTLKKAAETHAIERAQRKIKRHQNTPTLEAVVVNKAELVKKDIKMRDAILEKTVAGNVDLKLLDNEDSSTSDESDDSDSEADEAPASFPSSQISKHQTRMPEAPENSAGVLFQGGFSKWEDDTHLTSLSTAGEMEGVAQAGRSTMEVEKSATPPEMGELGKIPTQGSSLHANKGRRQSLLDAKKPKKREKKQNKSEN